MKNLFLKLFCVAIVVSTAYACSSFKKTNSETVSSDKGVGSSGIANENKSDSIKTVVPDFEDSKAERKWVDSIYKQLSFEEKLGQLFMVSAYSNRDSIHFNAIDKLIKDYKVGSLIFFQGGPKRQARLTNRFQSKAKVPLFIAIDGEWGLGMRLDSTYSFPWNMTLGAIQDKKLIEEVGVHIGKHTKRMGMHFNFGPVLDININPKNPIIGFRSFGEDKMKVTEYAGLMMKGLQSQGIIATGKHFPGHGDTDMDSHKALPTLNFTKERLTDIELYPYKKLFNEGLSSVMIAHLNIPSLEARENTPSSVSYNIVTKLLKEEMGFKGLIFTDALNMKAAANHRTPGQLDLECFLAGNDMLLCPDDVPVALESLKQAYKDTLFTDDRLEFSVKKILKYKYKAGLNNYKPINEASLVKDLNSPEDVALQYKLYENAITVLKNEDEILPIKDLTKSKIAYVKLGDNSGTNFLSTLKNYTEITEVAADNIDSLNVKLKEFNAVIVGFHKSDKAWKKHDYTAKEVLWLQKIAENNSNVILNVFANPYSLMQVKGMEKIKAIVVTFQNGPIAQEVSASMMFGAIESKGKLPVSLGEYFKIGDGLTTQKINRLGFTAPENVNMNSQILSKIEGVAYKAILGKMTPGIQVLVARKGKVIYHKAFGYHTYKKDLSVKTSDIYDVASVTKIVATLPNVMQEYDKGNLNFDTTLGSMILEAKGTDKDSIRFKDLLSHYARLQAWIPFYKSTLDSTKTPSKKYYRSSYSDKFKLQVSENLFLRNDYNDTILNTIIKSKLLDKREYKYSDFTFILLKEYLERINKKTLDNIAQENFFTRLGMNNTAYNPLQKFDISIIPPTEIDTYFRHTNVQGYVHDMGAAMQGGVAGHAGLFSNAMDIAKMMQMYLQKGNYGGIQFFSEKTFDDFNACHFCADENRRGLGFDKPQLGTESLPTCGCVSRASFGHTGFTGIMTWVDPETEILYVFVSNRTFPDSNAQNKLSKEHIREDIQKIIQEAIIK